ncbi:uncharacterized protein PV06_11913 [Exophiala oligosperma]|uniref:Major facilitator superfamily (MFS) profile domain-containing protein n=1 Tax=Exophiala oligosperma TaxID=215243 RepID=A0A0D2CXE0_9EURO|nr:uncharacterized protein PV06_11913 [Exophiala oligosperma]KIW35748.1 hypothetical protein PV06_11913 [Exophiala oligosperma]
MGTKFWEKMSGAQLTFMVSLFISFGYFFEGYNQGNMGFVNTAPSYQRLMGVDNKLGVLDPTKEGGIVAIYYIGGIIGGFWGGQVADKYGRIKAMIVGCLWTVVGGSLMTAAQNLA